MRFYLILRHFTLILNEQLWDVYNFFNFYHFCLTSATYPPDIFDILCNQSPGIAGEIQLADAVNKQAAQNAIETVILNGRRFDCGIVQVYLEVIRHVSYLRAI